LDLEDNTKIAWYINNLAAEEQLPQLLLLVIAICMVLLG
jgi:hypothetical protein